MKMFQFIIFSMLVLTAFKGQEENKINNTTVVKNKIEVIDFHTTHRCKTCLKIENNTKTLLQTAYKKEMKAGKISFRTINIDKKANYAIAERFEAAGTALFINVIKNGKETHIDLTDFAFMKAFNEKEFASQLKAKIDKQLKTL